MILLQAMMLVPFFLVIMFIVGTFLLYALLRIINLVRLHIFFPEAGDSEKKMIRARSRTRDIIISMLASLIFCIYTFLTFPFSDIN